MNPNEELRPEMIDKRVSLERWFDGDGLMRLFPDAGGNDNGILFAVEFYLLCHAQTHIGVAVSDTARFHRSVGLLRERPGLFNRNPGRNKDPEAFDNYIALVTGGELFGLPVAREICELGEKTNYHFDNVNPGAPSMRSWRQPGEVAFYQLMAGQKPNLGRFLWLCLGILANAFQSPQPKSSEWLTSWVRLKGLHLAAWRIGALSPRMAWALDFCRGIWIESLKAKTQGKGVEALMEIYFAPGHPNRLFSQGVVF